MTWSQREQRTATRPESVTLPGGHNLMRYQAAALSAELAALAELNTAVERR